MNSTQAKQRISELSKWLKNWNASYHSGIGDAQNLTSEQARDALKRELETLEKQYPELILPDSPTQRVGAPLSEQLPPIKHLTQKKSLPDAFSQKEVEEWIERGKKFSSELGMFFCETKIDGLNITVHYEKGKFIRALTRGDGKIGEDVSHSIRTISDVPLELPEPINIEVSGEVFIPIEKFVEINQEREKNNEDLFANPRNAAAGTVRTLDPTISAKRGLKMIFYELGQNNLQNPPKSQSELFKFFQRIGLPIAPDNLYQKCVNIKEISEFFDKIGKIRDDLKFGIDGIV
ncbi:MAG: NAD-dependent DNA ligase LigA, partial [Patescibacteria group bacterium]|nr:NAD-dependent DNA ligase LigA [Patescibacteria group bacterium]